MSGPEALPAPDPMTVTFDVKGWDEDRLVSYVAEQVQAHAHDRIEQAITERVEKALDAKLVEVLEGRLASMVDKLLAEGWHETGEWGTRGNLVTFRDRVANVLSKRTNDFGRNTSFVGKIVAGEASRMIRGDCRNAVDEALVKFKAEVDETLQAGLRESLRKGLGLK